MIAQTPYQNMIYSQPQMAYTPQMYNPWTTRPQSQVQPMPVEQPQQVMQPQVKPLTGKVVQTLEAITANDVPMDGTGGKLLQVVNACHVELSRLLSLCYG